MKKSFKYNELSDKVCAHPNCQRRLKKNLLSRQPKANLCYKHYKQTKITKAPENTNKYKRNGKGGAV